MGERLLEIQIYYIISAIQKNIPFLYNNLPIDTIVDTEAIQTHIYLGCAILNILKTGMSGQISYAIT